MCEAPRAQLGDTLQKGCYFHPSGPDLLQKEKIMQQYHGFHLLPTYNKSTEGQRIIKAGKYHQDHQVQLSVKQVFFMPGVQPIVSYPKVAFSLL